MEEEHPLVAEARIKMEISQSETDKAFMELVRTIIQSVIILIVITVGLYIIFNL